MNKYTEIFALLQPNDFGENVVGYSTRHLTLWEPSYDIFVFRFRPKKQQFSVALPTP